MGGGVVDVGAFLSNSPEYFMMKNSTEKEQEGKIITIVCSVSFSAAIDSKVIIQRGGIVCALADAIEMSGFRCEIIANRTSFSESGKFEIDVTLKKAQQSLNPNSAIEKKEYFSILISNCVAVEKNKR